MGDEEPWASITLEFIGGTDYKSVGNILGRMDNYVVRLRLRHQDPLAAALQGEFGVQRDVKLIDGSAIEDDGERTGGIYVVAVDEDGDVIKDAQEEFIAYEDIEALGIY